MSTPLQYESLKIVIQYLDPNLRFKLAQRIPTLCSIEKVVPLRIHTLKLSSMSMAINGTTYRLGVCREYHNETMPYDHWKTNKDGGLSHDLDQCGFDDHTGRDVLTPGDLVENHGLVPLHHVRNLDNEHANYERELRYYQEELARRLERGEKLPVVPKNETRDPDSMDLHFRTIFYYERFPEMRNGKTLEEMLSNVSTDALQFHITRLHASLASYYCRRDGTPLEWTPRIQLTVTKGEAKQIYRYAYTMKLYEAMKSLSSRFFGDRRQLINVRTLEAAKVDRVIRMPVGMKIKIQSLEVDANFPVIYKALEPIIDKTSLPLEKLTVLDEFEGLQDCELPALRTAKSVFLLDIYTEIDELFPIFVQLRNQNIHVQCKEWSEFVQVQADFIQHWMRSERQTRSRFSYEVQHLQYVKELEQEMKKRKEAGELQQNDSATLNNRHAEFRIEEVEETDDGKEKYIVILEDMEIPEK